MRSNNAMGGNAHPWCVRISAWLKSFHIEPRSLWVGVAHLVLVRPIRHRVIILLLALSTLAGCATDRYQRNLTHAYVTPWTYLSTEDREAIVRLITDRDQEPIIALARTSQTKRKALPFPSIPAT